MGSIRDASKSISTWEWLTLLLLLPVALFPAGPQSFLLLLIPIFWLVHYFAGEGFIPDSPFNLGLGVMFLMILVSLLVTFDYELSLTKIAGILYGMALLMASTRLIEARPSGIWWILTTILLAGAVMAVVGLVGVTWLAPFDAINTLKEGLPLALAAVPGAVGGVINENELAGALVWIAPLFIACLIGIPRTLGKRGPLLSLLLAAGTLLLSGVIVAT